MTIIDVLQNWYESICGGDICTGIHIETLDNREWYVSIDLFNTIYESKNFNSVHIKNSESNWFKCSKENGMFLGYGGIQNLGDILNVFCNLVKS